MTAREAALAIWRSALAAAVVEPLVHRVLGLEGTSLRCGPRTIDLRTRSGVVVLGCGKAGAPMAHAVEEIVGDRITAGFVVVKEGYTGPTRRVVLAEAGHPVPDERGREAAAHLARLAREASADDVVVFLVSGGGSALLPAPVPPVTLGEKQTTTRLLLAAGATIDELNAVRKHLSTLKGGQLARLAMPATVVSLILSDVIGDSLDVIASGPTAPDPTTFGEAVEVLLRRGLLDRVPEAVRRHLDAGVRGEVEETPKPGDGIFERVTNLVIGNNEAVVDAAATTAAGLGYRAEVVSRALQGEARRAARNLVDRARAMEPPACVLAGGETTVTVRGKGSGGRCQEFALAAAGALRPGEDLVILAAGTDGTDGPTDAAGALVDAGTVDRGRAAGHDVRVDLDDNDAHTFLAASGDLVITGPTNTNLLDLYLVLRPVPVR